MPTCLQDFKHETQIEIRAHRIQDITMTLNAYSLHYYLHNFNAIVATAAKGAASSCYGDLNQFCLYC